MSEVCDFLFELGTEELPPKSLLRLSEALENEIVNGLAELGLGHGEVQSYAAPRRLAVLIHQCQVQQQDRLVERRGPAVTAAFDADGLPTRAASGFATSCGVDVESLDRLETDKGAWLVYRAEQAGGRASELLPDVVRTALTHLPIPKRMRWGSLTEEFVRPVHWAVMLLGDDVIEAQILGVSSGRETRGHRFHHPENIYIAEPAAYAPVLETEGHVIASFADRREAIRGQVIETAVRSGGQAVIDEALLDEVTAMVEWPVALLGDFDRQFLQLPPEVLVSAMKGHQKYFHVVDDQGALMPHFITVSNIASRDIAVVRAGNERVIRPRLADAAFFWQQDGKQSLASRVESLQGVVFQKKLGTLYDKSHRVRALAGQIAIQLGADQVLAERAAQLSKCDLMTDMVGEFPELQGVMGRYYALHDGEPEMLAQALDEAYQPRFSGDVVPASPTGQAVALADKLDTLAGLFAINELPTGTRDPFALRRAALGVLRIIIENSLAELDLQVLIDTALQAFPDSLLTLQKTDRQTVAATLFAFMMDRLRVYYANQQVSPDVFEAVLARQPTRPLDFAARVRAVMSFQKLPEAEALAAAYKRSDNILRKFAGVVPEQVDAVLLTEPAEQQLAEQLQQLSAEVKPLLQLQDYSTALLALAALRTAVDRFFDEVLVMADDVVVRDNRLALLNGLRHLFLQVADLSCLQGLGHDQA
jgi:glycyl-tRNA synthetase beta chain